ncbi:PREDICTED: zinc finger protein 501-like [Mandrillus leucophaeus]|uniref:zinc finger protein 501-like n=1 Tax=Mandrillus leucophaeus TaxID=9568 RepID=UPI0005F52AD1|nr:PREDICTED: zinc finger protein 501-like [Mandrillus leucophaeus]
MAKFFTSFSKLAKHKRIHTREKLYKCEECGKACGWLLKHMRTHTGGKSYKCEECGRENPEGDFLQHQKIYIGEKSYKCSKCGKTFVQKLQLKKHQRVSARI